MKKLFLLLTAFALVVGLSACGGKCDEGYEKVDGECQLIPEDNEDPSISGVTDVELFVNAAFDPDAGVTATDAEDGDLTSSIQVSGTVDNTKTGTYTLTYTVTDSQGGTSTVTRTVTVTEADLVYPNGFYNYKFATTDLRHTFMAAAEKYLMNNMYAGVPLFASGSFALYSSRLQLPVDEHVAVMGYGTRFATMSTDDSTVMMEDGEFGNADEYTYRTQSSTNPVTFNQWIYDTSTDSDYMGEYYGALYDYVFNADKTGYEVVPVMASALPQPVSPTTTETGKEVATIWQIPIAEGLKWSYYQNGDAPSYVTDNDITAQDFVDTYRIALDEEWFRAISGGGDFLTSTQEVKGIKDYLNDKTQAKWDAAGIKVVDGKLQFEFVNEMSEWNVKYWLSSFVMAPIHTEMYDELESDYGTSPEDIAYHGPYVITYYEEDVILRLEKNPNYAKPALDFYTHKTFKIIEDSEIAFQTFVDGQLEAIGLPTAKFEEYKNHPGLKQIPGATTYRIMINSLEDTQGQQEQFPGSTWIPNPILANQDFKMSMFHALDRTYLAEDVLKTRTTNMYLFSNAYLVDAEKGVPYRQTAQGQTVGEGLSPSTNGYNKDASTALFKLAVQAMIDAGHITAGTEANPTVIELEFNYFSGSDSQVTMFEYIELAFEEAMVDDVNHVKVDLQGFAKDFPDIYYDYMMIGNFDLSIGGISGSTLDAASFLDTYSSDNRSGFTLNWGIDTSIAEIPVAYTDFQGVRHNEMWSFDAIYSALNGKVFLVDGEEAVIPAALDIASTPTTVTFTLDQFTNDDYKDVSYTIQAYNMAEDKYEDVTGYVAVVPTADADATAEGYQVVVTGLDPFFYGMDKTGATVYQGDYQIVVDFTYVEDDSDSSTTSPWFEMGALVSQGYNDDKGTPADATDDVEYKAVATTGKGAVLHVIANEADAQRTLDSVNIYTMGATEYEMITNTPVVAAVAGLTDTAVELDSVTVTGLEFNTTYVAELVYGTEMTYVTFKTLPEAVVAPVLNEGTVTTGDDKADDDYDEIYDTMANFEVEIEADAVTAGITVTGFDVYTPGMGLPVVDVKVADLTSGVVLNAGVYEVSGLDPEMDYFALVTMSNGAEFVYEFATLADLVEVAVYVDDNDTTEDETDDITMLDEDSATIEVTVNPMTMATIASVELYKAGALVATGVADTDGNYPFTGLMQGTDYVAMVTMSSGGEYEVEFTTVETTLDLSFVVNDNGTTTGEDPTADDYDEIMHNGFNFEFELNEDSEATIASVVVYKVGTEVPRVDVMEGTATWNATDEVYNVTGLTAETDYYVVVTTSNGVVEVLEVTTVAEPAPAS